ncbi:MAG: hypothetical protein K8953_01880 [Proteobacteria bacterium]|nr:hypothetical protein [Pseudomonadota bacterium]
MSDRLKNPVECAGCGVATHEPSIGRYAEPFCHECKDKENKAVGVLFSQAVNGDVK